jgi:hypothetical protein
MQGLRSRAGIVVSTACALALLSVPVIALGKGPPEVKGGGNETAATVAPPEAQPPGRVNKAGAEPKPAPKAPAAPKSPPPGQAKPKAVPRGQAKRQVAAPAPVPGRGPDGTGPPGQGAKKSGAPPHGHARGHSKRQPSSEPANGSSDPGGSPAEPGGAGSPDEPGRSPSADEPDVTGGIDLPRAEDVDGDGGQEADVAGPVASETVGLPEDASPETLPFTGLGLAFITLGGLVALTGGLLLRRAATR